MSWLGALTRRLTRASSDDEEHWVTWQGPISWLSNAVAAAGASTATGKWITSDIALRCSTVWRCVDLLSTLPAFIPLKVHESLPTGGSRVARDHHMFPLLYLRPNPWMTSYQLRQYIGMGVQLRGDGYAAMRYRTDGKIDRLIPVHPDKVKVLVDDDGYPIYEVTVQATGKPMRLQHWEMHHFFLHTLDGYHGLSPIAYAREAVGLALGAEEYGARLLGNGAVLSGILKVPTGSSPEAKAEAKRSWREGHSGLANAHKIAVLEGEMDFKPISMTSVDAQWIQMRSLQVEELCRFYGVPPELAQHTSPVSSWGTGVEQRFLAFLATKLNGILCPWEQLMQCDFFLPEEVDVFYPRFQRAALLQTDILTRYQVYAMGRAWGLLNANECRAREEENPIAGLAGETYLDPQNMHLIMPGQTQISTEQRAENARAVLAMARELAADGANHG
jgi:HK97 family phage portal protein